MEPGSLVLSRTEMCLDSVRDSVDQVLGREGTVQANLYQTNLAALSEHPVNGLLDGVVYRTHSDDDVQSASGAP